MSEQARRAHALLAAALAVEFALGAPAAAQEDVQALADRCAGGNATLAMRCLEGALALQAGQGGVGLLAAGGTQVPGAASTLGRRFGGAPRVSIGLRGTFAHVNIPDVPGGSLSEDDSFLGLGMQATVALGLLDGFSLRPTVGGVLSLDALATAGFVLLPGSRGFQGAPGAFGVGARLGLLRESFTLPGVTLALTHRWMGGVQLGELADGDALQAEFDPSVTSFRGVIGKDLLAVGVLLGVGWDRYATDGTLAVTGSSLVRVEDFDSSRWLAFGGASVSLVVVQFSVEAGWAGGYDSVPGRPSAAYDTGDSSLYLTLAGRLTL